MGINNPILTIVGRQGEDYVQHFFERLPDKVVCKECRYSSSYLWFFSGWLTANMLRKIKEVEPDQWKSNIKFEYLMKTSNTLLQPHIERHHLNLFLPLAKENGWKVLLPGLSSQARLEATSTAMSVSAEQHGHFNKHTFHQHLLNFIFADDQVSFVQKDLVSHILISYSMKSLNIIKCWEFRVLLLLLQGELTKAMIPHHTKLCEIIIQAWRQYFQVLKCNLSVPSFLLSTLSLTNHPPP